ncbi:hypothetical protein TrCOL_g3003 [Triparma columacea]|uniref:CAAX prenyl protease 2/Lysostaphin resistance protein A-like domain-containing protein n=1 Tax=Triparma columacea TaxID=722753 RepID=A0A9W7GH88_9STRA|nr:hypothetical protein TrCOL_g3003 [Triparma columacea]
MAKGHHLTRPLILLLLLSLTLTSTLSFTPSLPYHVQTRLNTITPATQSKSLSLQLPTSRSSPSLPPRARTYSLRPLHSTKGSEEADEFVPSVAASVVAGQSLFIPLSLAIGAIAKLKLISVPASELSASVVGGLYYTLPLCAFVLVTSAMERFIPPLKKVAEATESTILALLGSKRRLLTSVIFAAALGSVAGLGEELLFRGCIQQGLGMYLPQLPSLLLTSFLFALGHAVTPLYALISFIASMYFGWVYLSTGDLLIPIISHSLYDMVAVIATHWLVTGKTREERDALRKIGQN